MRPCFKKKFLSDFVAVTAQSSIKTQVCLGLSFLSNILMPQWNQGPGPCSSQPIPRCDFYSRALKMASPVSAMEFAGRRELEHARAVPVYLCLLLVTSCPSEWLRGRRTLPALSYCRRRKRRSNWGPWRPEFRRQHRGGACRGGEN